MKDNFPCLSPNVGLATLGFRKAQHGILPERLARPTERLEQAPSDNQPALKSSTENQEIIEAEIIEAVEDPDAEPA